MDITEVADSGVSKTLMSKNKTTPPGIKANVQDSFSMLASNPYANHLVAIDYAEQLP